MEYTTPTHPKAEYIVYSGMKPTTMVKTPTYTYEFNNKLGKQFAIPAIKFLNLDSHTFEISGSAPELMSIKYTELTVNKHKDEEILAKDKLRSYLTACSYACGLKQLAQTINNEFHQWTPCARKLLPVCQQSLHKDYHILGDFQTQAGKVKFDRSLLFDWLMKCSTSMTEYDDIEPDIAPIHAAVQTNLHWFLHELTMPDFINVLKSRLSKVLDKSPLVIQSDNTNPNITVNYKLTGSEIYASKDVNNFLAIIQYQNDKPLWDTIIKMCQITNRKDLTYTQFCNLWTQECADLVQISVYAKNAKVKQLFEDLAMRMQRFNQTKLPYMPTVKLEIFVPSEQGTKAQLVRSLGDHSSVSPINVTDRDFEDGLIYNIFKKFNYVEMQATLQHRSHVRPFYTKLLP